jgi:hypothetical protein
LDVLAKYGYEAHEARGWLFSDDHRAWRSIKLSSAVVTDPQWHSGVLWRVRQ